MRAALDAGRRHRQRHRRRCARRARSTCWPRHPSVRRLPDAHARRRRDRCRQRPRYDDVVAEVGELPARARATRCRRRGIAARAHRARPGHRLRQDASSTTSRCCARQRELLALGRPLLVGLVAQVARSGAVTGRPVDERLAGQRGGGAARRCSAARASCGCTTSAATRRRAEGLAGRRHAGASTTIRATQRRHTTMTQNYFGTDGIRGTVGRRRSRPTSCCGWAMPSAGCCRRSEAHAPDGADRQGHAHLRLHDRVGARSRLRLGRRRRAAHRPAADARRRLPDARAAARPGRRHQRVAQPVSATTASSSSRPRGEKLPDAWEPRSRRRWTSRRSGSTRPALGKARRIDDARGRYIEFCKSTFRSDLSLQGHEDRGRLRARRRLPRRARRLPRARRRGRRDRLQPERHQHQRRLRRHVARRRWSQAVREHGADFGIALDGDADRLQMVDARRPPLQRRRAALRDGRRPPGAGPAGAGRGRHADDQPGGRAGAARRGRRRSCAPRSATATCSKSWSRAAGSSAAKARATCWRSTSTPPATASSARCRCCRRCAAAASTLAAAARRRRRCSRRR